MQKALKNYSEKRRNCKKVSSIKNISIGIEDNNPVAAYWKFNLNSWFFNMGKQLVVKQTKEVL